MNTPSTHTPRAAAFIRDNQALCDAVEAATAWSDFAVSLMDGLRRYGSWSGRQIEAAKRLTAPREAVSVDLSPIRAMFDKALTAIKRPTYRAEGLILSLAPATGKNPDALYVKDRKTNAYLGKVVGTAYSGNATALAALATIAADPLEAAVRHGNATNFCSFCGRALTAGESVERGYGPVCRVRFGLT
jgi:hypothetical protein